MSGGVPGQEHYLSPTGPTVVAGGHVEPDEEVTNQLSQTAPSAKGETLSGTTWGVGWGKAKHKTCRSLVSLPPCSAAGQKERDALRLSGELSQRRC